VPRVRSSLFRPPRRRRRLRCGFSSMPSCRPHCCGFLRSAARRLLRVVTSDFETLSPLWANVVEQLRTGQGLVEGTERPKG
jgi:hypothetical protein